MIRRLVAFAALTFSLSVQSQGIPPDVFVQALQNGEATAPVARNHAIDVLAKAVQSRTGDSGPLQIQAYRINQFKQQPKCGRVGFFIAQPTSGKAWRDLGGELNICQGGMPPLRVCPDKPEVLVPLGKLCADRSNPVDTPESTAAIQSSLQQGGMTHSTVLRLMAANTQATTGKGVSK